MLSKHTDITGFLFGYLTTVFANCKNNFNFVVEFSQKVIFQIMLMNWLILAATWE